MILYREVRKLAARKASLRGVLVPMLRKYAGRRSPKEQTTVEHLVETALKRPRTSGPNELDDVIYDLLNEIPDEVFRSHINAWLKAVPPSGIEVLDFNITNTEEREGEVKDYSGDGPYAEEFMVDFTADVASEFTVELQITVPLKPMVQAWLAETRRRGWVFDKQVLTKAFVVLISGWKSTLEETLEDLFAEGDLELPELPQGAINDLVDLASSEMTTSGTGDHADFADVWDALGSYGIGSPQAHSDKANIKLVNNREMIITITAYVSAG